MAVKIFLIKTLVKVLKNSGKTKKIYRLTHLLLSLSKNDKYYEDKKILSHPVVSMLNLPVKISHLNHVHTRYPHLFHSFSLFHESSLVKDYFPSPATGFFVPKHPLI